MNQNLTPPIAPLGADEPLVCRHIIQRLGESGQPPEYGVRRINVGNESYLRVLETEYFEHQLRIGASFKLVQGFFGGGKTHFLFCVRELAWDRGFATAVVELSPAECPYDNAFKVYRTVVKRLGLKPAGILSAPAYGLPDMLRNIVDDRLDAALPAADDSPAAMERARKVVEHWLVSTVGRAPCESPSFRAAVVGFCRAVLRSDYTAEQRIEAWITGEPVPPGELHQDGIYEQLGTSNGFTMLRCLTQMVVGLGLPGTVLLFDEVDRNLSVSVRRSQIIGDNLRQVIDLCGRHQLPNTLFMYAVPPEFMRNIVPEYPALSQRLKSPVPLSVRSPQSVLIDLETLDLEPEALLCAMGLRILEVFETARGCRFARVVQTANAQMLARECVLRQFDVNHRRLFVKTWVEFLYRQYHDGEGVMHPDQAQRLLDQGYQAIQQATDGLGSDDFADF